MTTQTVVTIIAQTVVTMTTHYHYIATQTVVTMTTQTVVSMTAVVTNATNVP